MSNKKTLYVQVLVDKDSWVFPYAEELTRILNFKKHKAELINSEERIEKGDILIILGWGRVLDRKILSFHKHNLVAHASTLPKGKGWSPLTWQILEGRNEILLTLFEAVEELDSGPIYFQEVMRFKGYELIDELRKQQGEKIIKLVMKFVKSYPDIISRKQKGRETLYRRRISKDSEINIKKPIIQLFNKFRVADNEKYPIFFKHKGNKYILKIYKVSPENGRKK